MEMFQLYTRLQIQCSLRVCEPHPILLLVTHMGNNKEMAFNYIEVLVYGSFTHPRGDPTLLKGTAHRNKKSFGAKIKVNTCTKKKEEEEEMDGENQGISNFTYVIVAVYFTAFESLIM